MYEEGSPEDDEVPPDTCTQKGVMVHESSHE